LGADIGREGFNFSNLFGYRPVFADQPFPDKSQLRGEGFLRFAFYEQREDPVVPVQRREGFNLLANPLGMRCPGRADDYEVS